MNKYICIKNQFLKKNDLEIVPIRHKDIFLDDAHEAHYSFKNLHGVTQKMIGDIHENR